MTGAVPSRLLRGPGFTGARDQRGLKPNLTSSPASSPITATTPASSRCRIASCCQIRTPIMLDNLRQCFGLASRRDNQASAWVDLESGADGLSRDIKPGCIFCHVSVEKGFSVIESVCPVTTHYENDIRAHDVSADGRSPGP